VKARARRLASLALPAVLLLFVAARCLVPMDETDLFFNLRLGEIVLGTHAVPRTNLLSFTFPDYRDVNLAWLFQVVLALAHRAGGIPGTVLLKTGFVVATFAALYRVARRRGAHPAAAAAALALAAWAAEPRFVERPHLVTFLGLALTLLAIERAEAGRTRALYTLIPVGLIWANANSCFFLAPALLLLYAAGAAADGRRPYAVRAALVALALAPLIAATPSGLGGAASYIANHFRMPSLRPLQEYRSASWPVDGPFFFLAAAFLLTGLLESAFTGSRPRLRQALPIVALAALGASRIRFVAEFALLAGPAVAAQLTRALALSPPRPAAGRAAGVATGVLLLALAVMPHAAEVRRGGRWLDIGAEPDLVPLAAIRFAEQNGLRERMYNDLEVGSYLTWDGWPRYRVFQDPRINGYPPSLHAVLRRTDLSRAEWQALLDGFGVTAALVTYPALNPRAALFDPERWAVVYRARDGLVFARRRPEWQPLIARAELPVTFAYATDTGVTVKPLEVEPPGSPVDRCAWQRRLGDAYVEAGSTGSALDAYDHAMRDESCADGSDRLRAARGKGDAALALGQASAALEAYQRAGDQAPPVQRGLALLAAGRAGEALDAFRAALAVRADDADARLGEGMALKALGRRDEAAAALRTFLAQAPGHLAAPQARALLDQLSSRP
jgi:tetratricopeptide (TPR) repeat protein